MAADQFLEHFRKSVVVNVIAPPCKKEAMMPGYSILQESHSSGMPSQQGRSQQIAEAPRSVIILRSVQVLNTGTGLPFPEYPDKG
jgi:hypothetical protein